MNEAAGKNQVINNFLDNFRDYNHNEGHEFESRNRKIEKFRKIMETRRAQHRKEMQCMKQIQSGIQ